MTNSRSIISKSRWLAAIGVLVLCAVAHAGTRKRLVVLDFEGPKAEKFHDDLVRLMKKSHTVISNEKWNSAAEGLDAGKITEKNVKKVARKLKIDGVIQGKIEKRRDEYILHLKLRSGATGELAGNSVDTKSDGPRIAGKASRQIKEELGGAIDELAANHGGGSDDDEDKPVAKKKGSDDDDEDKPKHGGFSKKDDDAKGSDKVGKRKGGNDDDTVVVATKHDDDETPLPKTKKHPKKDDDEETTAPRKKHRVARGDDDDSTSVDAVADGTALTGAAALTPQQRAVDAVLGLSFTARRLTFVYQAGLMGPQIPPAYKESLPVAGATIDVTMFPLAIGHTRHDPLAGLGFNLAYDRVLKIQSEKAYTSSDGTSHIADLQTTESRLALGPVFRYPLGDGVVGAKLLYQSQLFRINPTLPNGMPTDIPSVKYSMVELGAFLRYPFGKLVFNADVGYLVLTGEGDIATTAQYGPMSGNGVEGSVGFDYMITTNIFARVQFRAATIGLAFKPNPDGLTNNRDGDSTTQDVTGARDTYLGGTATVGYLY